MEGFKTNTLRTEKPENAPGNNVYNIDVPDYSELQPVANDESDAEAVSVFDTEEIREVENMFEESAANDPDGAPIVSALDVEGVKIEKGDNVLEETAANDPDGAEIVSALDIEDAKIVDGDSTGSLFEGSAVNDENFEVSTKESVIKESEDLLTILAAREDLTPETEQLISKSFADINLLNSYSEADPELFKKNSERYLQMVMTNHVDLLELDNANKKTDYETLISEEKDIDTQLESAIVDFKQVQGKLEGLKVNDPNLEANISQGESVLGIVENYSESDPVRAKIEKAKYLKILHRNSTFLRGILGSQIDSADPKFNEYQNAREQWRESRSEYKEKKAEYHDSLKEFYGDKSFGAKMRSVKNSVRNFFGMDPDLPEDLVAKKALFKEGRNRYLKSVEKTLTARGGVDYGEYVDSKNREYTLDTDESKITFTDKFIKEPAEEVLKIQESAGLSPEKQAQLASVMEGLKKYKWHARTGALILAAGIAGAATGGVGAYVLGGGLYAARTTVGLGVGAAAGKGMHKGLDAGVKSSREHAKNVREGMSKKFSVGSLDVLEEEMIDADTEADRKAIRQKVLTVGAGAVAGGLSSAGIGMLSGSPLMSQAEASMNNRFGGNGGGMGPGDNIPEKFSGYANTVEDLENYQGNYVKPGLQSGGIETSVSNTHDVLPRNKPAVTLAENLVDSSVEEATEVSNIASEIVVPPEEIKTLYDLVVDRGGLQNSGVSIEVEGVPAEDILKMESVVNETMYDMARNQGNIPVDDFKATALYKAYAQIQEDYPNAEIKSLEFGQPHEVVSPVNLDSPGIESVPVEYVGSAEAIEQVVTLNEAIVPKFVDGTMKIGSFNMHLGGLNPQQTGIVEAFAKEAAVEIVKNNPDISVNQLGAQVGREVLDKFNDTELWKSVSKVGFGYGSESGTVRPSSHMVDQGRVFTPRPNVDNLNVDTANDFDMARHHQEMYDRGIRQRLHAVNNNYYGGQSQGNYYDNNWRPGGIRSGYNNFNQSMSQGRLQFQGGSQGFFQRSGYGRPH